MQHNTESPINQYVKDCGVGCKTLVSQVKVFNSRDRKEILRHETQLGNRTIGKDMRTKAGKRDGRNRNSLSNTTSEKYIKISKRNF